MSRPSKPVLAAFVLATLAGACLHFLYDLFPNPVTALFAPVNESLWEHLKILYWPYLASAAILTRWEGGALLGQRCFSLLLASLVMEAAGYVFCVLLGGESLAFDVGLFVLVMAAAFFLPGFLRGTVWSARRDLFLLLAAALGLFLVIFTFLPPQMILFADLSGARTWVTLPC